MTKVYAWDGVIPVVDPAAFIHPQAVLIGDVIVAADVYVGPCAVLRGDFGRIELKAGSNIQDTCVLHSFPGRDVIVEERGHVGHGAVLHGCHIGMNALIGMNAVVMDDAVVGEDSFVGAMSFVKAGSVIPARSLALGIPAMVKRQLTDAELAWKARGTEGYITLARLGPAKLQIVDPLAAVEPERPRVSASDHNPLHHLHGRFHDPDHF